MTAAAGLSIAPAGAADVQELSSLARACGLDVDFAAELSRSFAWVWTAREGALLHGFLVAWRAADELHLTDLGVSESSRRRGVGRALMEALFARGAATGARILFLEVRASNLPALALYRALGCVELDRRPRYYADTGEDAVVMQRELR